MPTGPRPAPARRAPAVGAAVRFAVAGGLTTAASLVAYALLLRALPPWAAWTGAYAAGVGLSYQLQRRWVHRARASARGAAAFPLVQVGAWALGLLVVRTWVEVLGLPDRAAAVAAVAVTAPLTFLVTRRLFRHPV